MLTTLTDPLCRGFCDIPDPYLDRLLPDDPSGGRTIRMTMAKASKQDIEMLGDLLQLLEEYIENGLLYEADENAEPNHNATPEQALERIEQFWNKGVFGWRRVVYGASSLIENACDHNNDVLAWREDISEFLASRAELDFIDPEAA